MTRVDFYVLQQDAMIARIHYACRLVEKALNHGHHIVLAVDDESQAINISDYLWSFKPESFLPHQLQSESGPAPIMLLWDEDKDHYHDILINLREEIPEWFSRFQRVTEIVVQHNDCLQHTRAHYQFYRDRGYPLKSHQIHG
jgi:DNA polymerase-3 subunit chi